MLTGRKVALRARIGSDVPILHSGLYEDVETHATSDTRAWQPISLDTDASPFRVREPVDKVSAFTVALLDDDRVAGDAVMWEIDRHNRSAHLGIALLPEMRGLGLGADVVAVLSRHAFHTLGLHRLQIETNVDNAAMLAVARGAGFAVEGTLRSASWANGRFVDEVILGLLADEWWAAHPLTS